MIRVERKQSHRAVWWAVKASQQRWGLPWAGPGMDGRLWTGGEEKARFPKEARVGATSTSPSYLHNMFRSRDWLKLKFYAEEQEMVIKTRHPG